MFSSFLFAILILELTLMCFYLSLIVIVIVALINNDRHSMDLNINIVQGLRNG